MFSDCNDSVTRCPSPLMTIRIKTGRTLGSSRRAQVGQSTLCNDSRAGHCDRARLQSARRFPPCRLIMSYSLGPGGDLSLHSLQSLLLDCRELEAGGVMDNRLAMRARSGNHHILDKQYPRRHHPFPIGFQGQLRIPRERVPVEDGLRWH